MRISQKELYHYADLLGAKIFITLDSILLTMDNQEYDFRGANKNRQAWRFLYNMAQSKVIKKLNKEEN